MQVLICVPETPHLEKNLNIVALVPSNSNKRKRFSKLRTGQKAMKDLGIKVLHATQRKRILKNTLRSLIPAIRMPTVKGEQSKIV